MLTIGKRVSIFYIDLKLAIDFAFFFLNAVCPTYVHNHLCGVDVIFIGILE